MARHSVLSVLCGKEKIDVARHSVLCGKDKIDVARHSVLAVGILLCARTLLLCRVCTNKRRPSISLDTPCKRSVCW